MGSAEACLKWANQNARFFGIVLPIQSKSHLNLMVSPLTMEKIFANLRSLNTSGINASKALVQEAKLFSKWGSKSIVQDSFGISFNTSQYSPRLLIVFTNSPKSTGLRM